MNFLEAYEEMKNGKEAFFKSTQRAGAKYRIIKHEKSVGIYGKEKTETIKFQFKSFPVEDVWYDINEIFIDMAISNDWQVF